MGAEIRKEGILIVDGHESRILQQSRQADEQEGWSITSRPYRPRPQEKLLENLGTDGCTCLLAGNRVLMADGSTKPIETVVVGDKVMTTEGPARVRLTETTRLGLTRKIIELRGHGDECLVMTDDHPLWVSRPVSGGARKEWWGTYNLNHVLYEMRNTIGFELGELPMALAIDLPEQVAHVSGWMHVRPIYHHLDPETTVHHLLVEGACTFIAEGFPVFSHCLDKLAPAAPWGGLAHDAAAERFVAGLVAAA